MFILTDQTKQYQKWTEELKEKRIEVRCMYAHEKRKIQRLKAENRAMTINRFLVTAIGEATKWIELIQQLINGINDTTKD